MARRRKRKKRQFPKITLFVCVTALIIGFGVAGAQLLPVFLKTAEEAVSLVGQQKVEFPELTVTAEEVARDFYYQQLNSEEQTVYRELLQGVTGMEECIRVHAGEEDDPGRVFEYLLYDRPEIFWCDGSTRLTIYETYTEVYPGYSCTEAQKEQRQQEIEEAAASCTGGISQDASDYEKVKYVYEYLVNTVDYDEDAPDNQNIYSSLVGKRSVCAGYSRAAQYLLDDLRVECIYVVGNVTGQGAHAWNIVNCDGAYYQMDVTFGDPVFLEEEGQESVPAESINYDYLCATDEEFAVNHEQSDLVRYPACTSDDLNYYKLNGMYYDTYDPDAMLQDMNESVYAKEDSFVCKFEDQTLYESARDDVIENLLPQAAQNLAVSYGLERVRYTYAEDAGHNKITVFWSYEEE